jgi:hypothetical protein
MLVSVISACRAFVKFRLSSSRICRFARYLLRCNDLRVGIYSGGWRGHLQGGGRVGCLDGIERDGFDEIFAGEC